METSLLAGVFVVVASGLIMGTSAWPLKLMRHFQYEHFGFVSMLLSLLLLPWSITLLSCPDVLAAYRSVPAEVIVKANIFSFCWGIAQVLALLCFVRIGVSLTYGILCAVGAAVGVLVPLIFKASGAFASAPDLFSTTGLVVMIGVAVLVAGVSLAAKAGFGREEIQATQADAVGSHSKPARNKFAVGLLMVLIAGVLSAGWGFAFAYSQAPIIAAAKSRGASDFFAGIAVWSVALLGAGFVNVLYPAWLMTKHRSWGILLLYPREAALALVYGVLFFIPSILLGKGMLLLGPLGASVGWGLVQGTLILGGQLLGFATGEWRGVYGPPRRQIFTAIVLLVVAMVILALANGLASGPPI